MYEKYGEQGVCPICGGKNSSGELPSFKDVIMLVPINCADCGENYHESYSVKFIGNFVKIGEDVTKAFEG